MPLHSAMSGSELHEDKLISTATIADAGKVTTPSGATDGEGELRKLLVTELNTNTADTLEGQVLVQSGTTNLGQMRYLFPEDLDGHMQVVSADFADIGTAETAWAVAPIPVTDVRIRVVLYGAITGTDETVTVTVGTADPITLTVPVSGSGAGVVTSGNLVGLSADQAAGVAIEVATAGDSTGAAVARVFLELRSGK